MRLTPVHYGSQEVLSVKSLAGRLVAAAGVLIFCCAPVTRKGAETLVTLAKQGQRQKTLAAMVAPTPTNALALPSSHPGYTVPKTNWVLPAFRYPRGAETNWWELQKLCDTNGWQTISGKFYGTNQGGQMTIVSTNPWAIFRTRQTKP